MLVNIGFLSHNCSNLPLSLLTLFSKLTLQWLEGWARISHTLIMISGRTLSFFNQLWFNWRVGGAAVVKQYLKDFTRRVFSSNRLYQLASNPILRQHCKNLKILWRQKNILNLQWTSLTGGNKIDKSGLMATARGHMNRILSIGSRFIETPI